MNQRAATADIPVREPGDVQRVCAVGGGRAHDASLHRWAAGCHLGAASERALERLSGRQRGREVPVHLGRADGAMLAAEIARTAG